MSRLSLVVFACVATAEVRLPYLLADHMVVQRDIPVHVWGTADPGEGVTVSFRGETRKADTDGLGRWSVWLKPGGPGGPFELRINSVTLKNVMAGDVWIAAGQSNMSGLCAGRPSPTKSAAPPTGRTSASPAPCIAYCPKTRTR